MKHACTNHFMDFASRGRKKTELVSKFANLENGLRPHYFE